MRWRAWAALSAAMVVSCAGGGTSQPRKPFSPPTAGEERAVDIATDAYIYGYSLITTEVTRVQMSNVSKADGLHAPMNQFINIKRYPPADYRGVSAPNADTLYSLAWVDLSQPMVFSHPAMGKRYYLFELVDLWMNVLESPSARTAGGAAEKYLLTGPGWQGKVPKGMTQIPVATRYLAILGRTYADGTERDYKAVNALQAQYKLTPLASGKTYKAPPVVRDPGFSMSAKPQDAIIGLGTDGYFNLLAKLMGGAAPPAPADGPMLERMAKIGLVPGQPFDASKLDPDVRAALADLPKLALGAIEGEHNSLGALENGWVITKGLGVYGTDYMKRAVVAAFGWPANREEDAVYPYTDVDAAGQRLNGAHTYTLTFPKGATPPVDAFWSITMYEIDQGWWFVPNALNKFTVSPRDKLVYAKDGSLTLYFQNASPGKPLEANWLPAPTGDFILMLRMYWPKEKPPSILDGSWLPPAVVQTN